MNSLLQFDIPRRNTQCTHLGERLLPGMEIFSLLVEEKGVRLARHDYCLSCWNQVRDKQCEQPVSHGYWKSTIEKRKVAEGSSRIERALLLLRELQQSPDSKEEEVFILCLFLSHARQLALRQEFKMEEGTYHLYEILRKEEFLKVKVVNLSEIQIDALKKSLAEQLQ